MRRFAAIPIVALVFALGCEKNITDPGTAPEVAPAVVATAAAALSFRQVAPGAYHTCGVTIANRAYCWGSNYLGQLGDGTRVERPKPVAVSGGLSFRQLSAGGSHTCGVTADNRAYCWGHNRWGQLGDGTTTQSGRPTPVAVAGGLTFQRVSAGFGHTCGVTTDNRAYCWGYNTHGQLGDGTLADRLTPVAVRAGIKNLQLRFVQVNASFPSNAGFSHTCGLTTLNRAYCWGSNDFGQLGDGTTTQRLAPVAVSGGFSLRQVAPGSYHTCGVSTADKAYCWGHNLYAELGDGTKINRLMPIAVRGGLGFRQVAPGSFHTCGTTTLYSAYCWGSNSLGQLGDGTRTRRLTPVRVGVPFWLHKFRAVAGGGAHTCGVTTADRAYCWGFNLYGQVGDGTFTEARLRPVAVAGAS